MNVVFVAVAALLSAAGIPRDAMPMPGTRANMVRSEGLPPELSESLGNLLAGVESVRGLEAKGVVRARMSTKAELVAYMQGQIDQPAAKRQFETTQAFLKAIGAVGPDVDLPGTMRNFVAEQVAGYYDWKQKVLYMADWIPQEIQSLTLAHELTHALQDQHFGLERLVDGVDGVSEPYSAAQGLMEGDATLTMLIRTAGGRVDNAWVDAAVKAVIAGAMIPDSTTASVPRVITDSLLFPYTDGLKFVAEIYKSGGFVAVNDMFAHPPLSTEQIIHPEKCRYLSAAAGQPEDLPNDVILTLAGIPGLPAGVPVGSDIAGEVGLRSIFRDVMDRPAADRAAAGWDGDRFVSWRSEDGSASAVLASVWDSPGDAVEAGAAISETRIGPAAVFIKGQRMVAVWGPARDKADRIARSVAISMEIVETGSWQEWIRKGPAAVSKSLRKLR